MKSTEAQNAEVAARPRKPWTRRPQAPLASLPPGMLLSARQAREALPFKLSGDVLRQRARRSSPFAPPWQLNERGERVFQVAQLREFIARMGPLAAQHCPNLARNANAEELPTCPLEDLPPGRLLGMTAVGSYLGITRGAVWRRHKRKLFPVLPWRWIGGSWRLRADELLLAMPIMRTPSEQGRINAAARRRKAEARKHALRAHEAPTARP